MESALYDFYSLLEAYQKTRELKSYARTFPEVISISLLFVCLQVLRTSF